ncbi:MAG: hypothetical protein RLZZ387_2192 [Chloroflexota bacterium]|jgi:hypothetical protein
MSLGALALLWAVREAPIAAPPLLAADALGAFFALAVFGGLTLTAITLPEGERLGWRPLAAAMTLAAAFLTALTPVVIVCYAALALLTVPRVPGRCLPAPRDLLAPLGAALLAVGYGILALRGAVRYDERAAGAALDSLVFWFVLLAAIAPLLPLGSSEPSTERPALAILRIAWLYPLVRLYSLGPWNEGWTLATILLGSGAGLWAALAALRSARGGGDLLVPACLAVAGFGLSTGAGLAAGCYGVLTYLVLAAASGANERDTTAHGSRPTTRDLSWLLTPAVPFGAPFVATWMLVGAGVAGGVSLTAAAAWLAALLAAAAHLVAPVPRPPRATPTAAAASLLLGVLAPLIVLVLVQPVIAQLQGGLSVYGDINVWPWVGLAAVDSARRGVTALPSVAAAALMLVLSALVYLGARLRQELAPGDAPGDDGRAARPDGIAGALRAEVPWLARDGEPAGDDR